MVALCPTDPVPPGESLPVESLRVERPGARRTSQHPGKSRPAVGDESFPRAHRLRQRREFLVVYEKGRRVHGRLAVVFCLKRDADGPWRLGLTVTRKVGGAVVRNRLKRLAREFFRRNQKDFGRGLDFVVNLKQPAQEAPAEELFTDLSGILRRMGLGGEPVGDIERGTPKA